MGRESESSLALALAFSPSLTLSHTHRWFSHLSHMQILLWELSAGGRGREVSQSPLTLENKPKQPRRLMTQYTPLATEALSHLAGPGQGGERHRHRGRMVTISDCFSLGTEDEAPVF